MPRDQELKRPHMGSYQYGGRGQFRSILCKAGDFETRPGISKNRAEKDFQQHRRDIGDPDVAPVYDRIQVDVAEGIKPRIEKAAAAQGKTMRRYLGDLLVYLHPEDDGG